MEFINTAVSQNRQFFLNAAEQAVFAVFWKNDPFFQYCDRYRWPLYLNINTVIVTGYRRLLKSWQQNRTA